MSSLQCMQLIRWTLNNFTVFPPEKIIFQGKLGKPCPLCPVLSPNHATALRHSPCLSATQNDCMGGHPVQPPFPEAPGSCQALAQPGGCKGGRDVPCPQWTVRQVGTGLTGCVPGPRGNGERRMRGGGERGSAPRCWEGQEEVSEGEDRPESRREEMACAETGGPGGVARRADSQPVCQPRFTERL